VLFFVVWVATNPGILLADDFFSLFTESGVESSEEMVEGAIRPNLWLFYLGVLKESMGWPLLSVSLCGAAYALWKRRPADWMLLSYGVVNYVAIASTTSENLYFPRYALPIIIVLSILAGRVMAEMIDLLPKWRAAVATAFILLVTVGPLTQSARFSYSLTQTDTRTLAKEWIDANIPSGSKVLIEGGKIAASRLTVQLDDSKESLDRRIEYWRVVEPRQAKFLQIRRSVHEGGGYELELVRVNSVMPLDEYLNRGIEYFVVRPESFLGSRKADSDSAKFMGALQRHAKIRMIARFEAGDSLRQGPPIEVYRIDRTASQGS
jgi:hypothetical protein